MFGDLAYARQSGVPYLETLVALPPATPPLALFGEAAHPVIAALAEFDLDALNPEQALTELRRLKTLGGS